MMNLYWLLMCLLSFESDLNNILVVFQAGIRLEQFWSYIYI